MSLPAALVGGALGLAYVWFVYRDFVHTAIAAVIVAVAVVFIIYSQSREQKADRKAAKERPELEDGSRFSSVEWRKGYLDFAQEKGWETPKRKSMKADMCRHYNNGTDRAMILVGAFFTASAVQSSVAACGCGRDRPWCFLPVFRHKGHLRLSCAEMAESHKAPP